MPDKNFASGISDKSGAEWLTAGPGEHFCVRIPAAAAEGAYSLTEMVLSPGSSTPLHVHAKEDEYIEALIPSNASGGKRPRCFSLAELAERPSMASQ